MRNLVDSWETMISLDLFDLEKILSHEWGKIIQSYFDIAHLDKTNTLLNDKILIITI